MATSGSFNTPQWHDYFSLKFEWSLKSQSMEKNTSVISWSLKGETPSWITGMVTCGYFTITVDGIVVYSTGKYDRVNVYNGTVIATGEATVTHSADGTETFGVDIKAAVYDGEVNTTAYAEFSLPTIARSSELTLSASSVNFGSEITVNINSMSDSFTHTLYYSINGGAEVEITDDIGALYRWTVPYSLMSDIPNAKSATITLKLYTYNGSTNVGNSTASFTANVPDNSTTKPSVTLNSLLPVNGLPSKFSSLYVQGKSKVQANVSSSGKYGATITSCVMTVDGVSYGATQNYTSGYLTSYGVKTVTITATDSRGLSNSISQEINVIAYSVPKINVITCNRCDTSGNISDSGTYLKIVAQRTYSKVMSDDIQNNFCLIRYRYKALADPSYSAWITILAKDSLSSDVITTDPLLGGTLAVSASYNVQIQALDDIGEYAETTVNIETETVHNHKAPSGWGFGKYCEVEEGFDMGWDIELNDNEIYKNGVKAFAPDGLVIGHYSLASIAEVEAKILEIEQAMPTHSVAYFTWMGTGTSGASSGIPYNQNNWIVKIYKLHASNYAMVEMETYATNGYKACNIMANGVFKGWEWINPPLVAGVEYRTTERWGDKAVYRKLVKHTDNTGFSGDTLYSIPHGLSDLDRSYGVEIVARTQGFQIPYIATGETTAVTGCTATNIELRTTGVTRWSAGRVWYFDMKYVKTS